MEKATNASILERNKAHDAVLSSENESKGAFAGCSYTIDDSKRDFSGVTAENGGTASYDLSADDMSGDGILLKNPIINKKTCLLLKASVLIIRMLSTFMERVVLYFGLFLCILGICFASYASMGTISFEEMYKDGLYALFLDINNALPSFCLIIVLLERISAHPFYRLSYPDEYIRTFLIRFTGWFAYDCILILLIYRYASGLSTAPFYAGGPYAEFHYPGTISLLIAFKLMSIAIKNIPHSIIRIYSYYRRIKASRADMDTYIRGILK